MTLKEKIKNHPAFKDLYYEEDNGYWCAIKQEYIDDESGCNSLHEFTLSEIYYRLKHYVKKISDLSPERRKFHGI